MSTNPESNWKPEHRRVLILSTTPPSKSLIPESPFPQLLEGLTGVKPVNDSNSFAGFIPQEPIRLRTKYYNADLPIWCDELPWPPPVGPESIPQPEESHQTENPTNIDTNETKTPNRDPIEDPPATLEEWKTQMCSEAAKEVRAVLGGIILILPSTTSPDLAKIMEYYEPVLEAVDEVCQRFLDECNYAQSLSSICLIHPFGSKKITQADLDDVVEALEMHRNECPGTSEWDFVPWDIRPQAIRKQGESERYDKIGIERVLEVLELNEWAVEADSEDENNDYSDDETWQEFTTGSQDHPKVHSKPSEASGGGRLKGFDLELQEELIKSESKSPPIMQKSRGDGSDINEHDDKLPPVEEEEQGEDMSIEQMQGLMERVLAIREAGSEMSKAEREQFAKREIKNIMKEMR